MTHGILCVYIAVAGVFGGWALGYMAAEGIRAQGWRVWVVEMTIALAFAAFWPLVLIAVPTMMLIARRRKLEKQQMDMFL